MILFVSFIYLLFPIPSIPFVILSIFFDKKHQKYYLFLIILLLSLIGYYFIPNISSDLYSHSLSIEAYKSKTIIDVFTNIYEEPLLFKNLIFFVFSRIDNYNLLSLFTVLITYCTFIFTIFNFQKKEKIYGYSKIFSLLLMLSLIDFASTYSGIRFILVTAFFIFSINREFIEEKKDILTYLLYILSIFLHYAGIIYLIFRLFLLIKNKAFRILLFCILLSWGIYFGQILTLLEMTNISYFQGIKLKMLLYSEYTLQEAGRAMYVFNIVKIFFSLFYIFLYLKNCKKTEFINKYKSFFSIGLFWSLFLIGGISKIILVERFGYLVIFFTLMLLQFHYKQNRKFVILINSMNVFFIFFGLYFQYARSYWREFAFDSFDYLRNIVYLFFSRHN